MATGPEPNPETVEALLDTTWRVAAAESARTDALDRKASSLATFAALSTSLIATLGVRSADVAERWWTSALFFASLALLVLALGFAVRALMPREYVTLGMAYLRRFPTWSEILKPPAQVRGETMRGVIEAIARERDANDVKARSVKRAFALLAFALVLIAIEAITLTVLE